MLSSSNYLPTYVSIVFQKYENFTALTVSFFVYRLFCKKENEDISFAECRRLGYQIFNLQNTFL